MIKKSQLKKLYVLVAVLLTIMLVFCTSVSNTAFAATTKETFEGTNVLDDLTGSTINGTSFNLSDYPLKENGEPQLISFLEYCYSYKSTMQKNYGLYIYVYNPQGLAFNTSTDRNKIQLRYGEVGNYNKYNLQFLNHSTKAGYEGLFYKFRIVLSTEQRNTILKTVKQDARVYEVSGFELCVGSEIKEYKIATTYTYSGYAYEYGPPAATTSTLSCTTNGIKDVITIDDLGFSYYRPVGTNGKSDYTQDSLHSVYFAVPNTYINKFGEMTAVHATWYNAVIKPMLVTGNKSAYDAIVPELGKSKTYDNSWPYCYLGDDYIQGTHHYFGYHYNMIHGGYYEGFTATAHYVHDKYGEHVDPLYYIFYSGDGTDSADNFTVKSKVLEEEMRASVSRFGGDTVLDKYSASIFESVDTTPQDVTIQATDTFSLTSETFSQSWLQQLLGGRTLAGTKLSEVNAIQKVTDTEMAGTSKEVANRLFISESDYSDLNEYYNKYKADSTVYLYRYMLSDYDCQEASLVSIKGSRQDTNAYFFKETVNLDFDIIDLTFTKDGVKTVVPVVMTPIDIIHDATKPVITHSDIEDLDWLKKLLALIALVLVLVFCMPILPYVIKFIVWIIMLPIRIVIAMFKGIKSLFKKKE